MDYNSQQLEFLARQYERMQELTATYAQLGIKTLSIISGGALVAIGAAFVSFATNANKNNFENMKAIGSALSRSFDCFCTASLINLFLIFFTCISRNLFQKACNQNNSDATARLERWGNIFEYLAFILAIGNIIFVFSGLYILQNGFSSFFNL